MKVGINLINFGPSARPDVLAGWAQLAERLGYHSLFTSDHIAITPDVSERYPAPFYEPLSTLGWLAGVTERITLGTTVMILPYRSPLELARAYANVDQLSGGRTVLGVGVGWAQREFEALGLPFRRRGAMTDEYLEVIRRHWSEPLLDFDGSFLTCEGVDTAPRPVGQIPIWVGGSSAAALRRTVRLGTAWHPIRLRPSWFVDTAVPRLYSVADELELPRPALCPRIMFHVTDAPTPDAERFMGHGTRDQIHHDLGVLEELGCEHVILDAYSPFDDVELRDVSDYHERAWEQYEIFAAEVLDLPGETVR